ncbi:DsbE family thiol:disulfide interchange protein [Pararhodospirillum photometricum]|uniref:Periplasmic protein thiol-disulfide oxidoreductase DsbE n=1 Tax=Pararhodospirillum photometricum DSM 122 TaxID=1150469 RepID=H6SJZ1_PARPM|nr:DsbE family thiol:disulfide interchange protein [Pararhodospirillum photometricum]CCG08306.1 Periplasmic protein thiol-disulfide oxidoreductase DsbE [Pararhodospirillum photometricum DSM 122]
MTPSPSPDPEETAPLPFVAAKRPKRWVYFLPLGVVALLVVLFLVGLDRDPRLLPSQLINRPLPAFSLEPLPGRGRPLDSAALKGDVSLVNVFGSWCVACQQEHPMLLAIQREGLVRIHGVDWREKDPADGLAWLNRHGDPYDRVGLDPDSHVVIDLGVTGAPETFVVDAQGVVRYKHTGPITPEVWSQTLKPLILSLREGQP